MNFMPFILIDTNSFKDLIMSVLEFNVFIKKKENIKLFIFKKQLLYCIRYVYTLYALKKIIPNHT